MICSCKKTDQKSIKNILQKTILIYNKSKIYIDKGRFAKNTASCKYDCLFDVVALIEDNVWVLQVQKAAHNHEPILFGTPPTHKKATITQDV